MECKEFPFIEFRIDIRGFNRDIMECKDSCHLAGIKRRQRFNRDIVECKDRALNIAVTSREGRVSRNSAIRFAA